MHTKCNFCKLPFVFGQVRYHATELDNTITTYHEHCWCFTEHGQHGIHPQFVSFEGYNVLQRAANDQVLLTGPPFDDLLLVPIH